MTIENYLAEWLSSGRRPSRPAAEGGIDDDIGTD